MPGIHFAKKAQAAQILRCCNRLELYRHAHLGGESILPMVVGGAKAQVEIQGQDVDQVALSRLLVCCEVSGLVSDYALSRQEIAMPKSLSITGISGRSHAGIVFAAATLSVKNWHG